MSRMMEKYVYITEGYLSRKMYKCQEGAHDLSKKAVN